MDSADFYKNSTYFLNTASAKKYDMKITETLDNVSSHRDFRLRTGTKFSPEVQEAIDGVSFIAEHMKSDDNDQSVSENEKSSQSFQTSSPVPLCNTLFFRKAIWTL